MHDQQEQWDRLSARERLSQISHHFLSEDETTGATDAPLFFVAVPPVDAGGPADLTLDRLGGAFVSAGTAVAVTDADRSGLSLMYPRGVPEEHRGAVRRNGPGGDIRRLLESARGQRRPDVVLTTEIPAAVEPGDLLVTLVAVPCERDGMRRAFVRLKELAAAGQSVAAVTGAAVCGAADSLQAERCFHKFAFAAHHFVGLTVTSYGCFSRVDRRTADRGRDGERGLRDVVNLLLEDWRAWNGRRLAENAHQRPDGPEPAHLGEAHEPATEKRAADAR